MSCPGRYHPPTYHRTKRRLVTASLTIWPLICIFMVLCGFLLQKMAIVPITYSHTWTFSNPHYAFPLFHSCTNFTRIKFSPTKYGDGLSPSSPLSHFRVFCRSERETNEIRRCAPFLESSTLVDNGGVASDEWKVVPDIWRSSAEKYRDNVALVDTCHHPPTTMTYKQVEQAILYFAEGLRVIGVKPDEKLALFADNSCHWLVADQGALKFHFSLPPLSVYSV
ncbi:hypothetical protein V8G54_002858 [Vigna mungo]|uniref:AMP-dependent synthetase/ligase domain-containing protein n=1 Tax=Vigna mungo TaxID=3915 RepID=A0AAQ3PB26_VIGMU